MIQEYYDSSMMGCYKKTVKKIIFIISTLVDKELALFMANSYNLVEKFAFNRFLIL